MAGQHRFAAFVSYSSADSAFARRLHRALESYRVPAGAGSFNITGKANRIAPVFLDRAELSSGELGAAITSAIETSSALIVVCSPGAVKSEWVDKEIRHFIQTGRVRRIFAVIASGEPFASLHGAADNECFPQALRELAKGAFGNAYEVVAGDARPGRDGFRNAWLKVAAGILDVGFGRLLDRDAAARRARTTLLGGMAVAVAAVVGTLTTFWFLESQRYQSEARASLLREARSAFELDDSARAITALASLAAGMSAEERAQFQPVLESWSPRFPHLAASLASAPPAFAYGERVFLKRPEGILASPLPANAVVAARDDEETVLAIDFTGRVWQWRPGEAEARDIGLPADALGGHNWTTALKLTGGGAVFGGSVQASYAGGEDPVVLVVNERARSFALVTLGYTPLEDLRLASDCSAFAFRASSLDYDFGSAEEGAVVEEIKIDQGIQRLDLRAETAKQEQISEEAFQGIPQLKVDPDANPYDRATAVLNAFATACGGGRIATGAPPNIAVMQTISSADAIPADDPDKPASGWDWVAQDRWSAEPQGDGTEIARIAALTDAIQRAKLEIGKKTRIRDGEIDRVAPQEDTAWEEPDPQADAELVSFEYSVRLGVQLSYDSAGEPALAFYAAEGKYVGSNVCGFVNGKAKCINMMQNGQGVQFAAFPDFIYAGGTNYLGYPLFTLIDRRTFDAVEFRSDEIDIFEPAYAGSVALSPSGKQIAVAFARTVLLFDLDEGLVPRLARKLDVPGLADGADARLRGVCAALTYLDDSTLVASRGDGLNLKLDLQSGEEVWRFRLPASVGCDAGFPYVPVQAAVSPDGQHLVVRGSGFAALLDTRTGLPLLPTTRFDAVTRWEDEGFYSEESAAQIAGDLDFETEATPAAEANPAPDTDADCARDGTGCSSEMELTRSARTLAKISEPFLVMMPSGEVWLRSLSYNISLAPPPARVAPVAVTAAPQCFTGWQVSGTRIEPFDLMKDVKIGAAAVPEADLLATCK